MKSILGVVAVIALALAIVSGALLMVNTNPRIDAAQQTANTAQTTANAAMARADEAYTRAERASGTAELALTAIAAMQRGDTVAIVGIVIGGVALAMFGLLLFLIWDRGEQRKQALLAMQLRAWLYGGMPVDRRYDIETDEYVPLRLPSRK